MSILKFKINCIVFVTLFSCGKREISFRSDFALEWIKKQSELGPRFVGSQAHQSLQRMIIDSLKQLSDDVKLHRFTLRPIGIDSSINGINIIAALYPEKSKRIVLSSHYDTHPHSEKEVDSLKRQLPIIGSNDGASGVAIIMALLSQIKEINPEIGIDIIFFDAEDLGSSKYPDNYCLGSKEFAKKMKGKYYPFLAINIDMVGGAQSEFLFEAHSYQASASIATFYERIWDQALILNYTDFKKKIGHAIYDDHIPLINIGIPAVNIIDNHMFNPNSVHHTQGDNLLEISQESLHKVGQTILNYLRTL